jgi:hypothetical protein
VTGQVGHGPEGADPSVDSELFTWVDAAYNTDFAPEEGSEDINNDEYQAQITEDEAGVYRYAYRFSGDGGGTWTYCDLGAGSEDGFRAVLHGHADGRRADDRLCKTCSIPAENDEPRRARRRRTLRPRLYRGCTDGANYCGGLTAQVGHGPQGTNPSTRRRATTPGPTASYNGDHVDDNNDRYQSQIVENDEGDYNFAYRFSADAGRDVDLLRSGQFGQRRVDRSARPAARGRRVDSDRLVQHSMPRIDGHHRGHADREHLRPASMWKAYTGGGSALGPDHREAGVGSAGHGDPATKPQRLHVGLDVAFNTSVGNDDEYMAAITPGAAGTFNYGIASRPTAAQAGRTAISATASPTAITVGRSGHADGHLGQVRSNVDETLRGFAFPVHDAWRCSCPWRPAATPMTTTTSGGPLLDDDDDTTDGRFVRRRYERRRRQRATTTTRATIRHHADR